MQRYTLPAAKPNELGGIKVGEDFTIGKDGTLNLKDNPEALQQQTEQLYQNVAAGKALVAAAITDKKVPTSVDATFQTMACNINKINIQNYKKERWLDNGNVLKKFSRAYSNWYLSGEFGSNNYDTHILNDRLNLKPTYAGGTCGIMFKDIDITNINQICVRAKRTEYVNSQNNTYIMLVDDSYISNAPDGATDRYGNTIEYVEKGDATNYIYSRNTNSTEIGDNNIVADVSELIGVFHVYIAAFWCGIEVSSIYVTRKLVDMET